MGFDLNRIPGITQMQSDIAQGILSDSAKAQAANRKTNQAEQLRKDKIRHDKEQRRREMEKRSYNPDSDEESEDGGTLDLVA